MPSSRGSSWPRDRTWVSYVFCIRRQVFLPLVPLPPIENAPILSIHVLMNVQTLVTVTTIKELSFIQPPEFLIALNSQSPLLHPSPRQPLIWFLLTIYWNHLLSICMEVESYKARALLHLPSFYVACFPEPSCCCRYFWLAPFNCWVMFHCTEIPLFIHSPFSGCLFSVFGYDE